MTSYEQENLDRRLIDAAKRGNTETVRTLLATGANVHTHDGSALRWAACNGHTETAQTLLTAGANVRAGNDYALWRAAQNGHAETVRILARHIFAPDTWRGKNRAEIGAYATFLYEKIQTEDIISPEDLHKARTILADCALTCWEQVRPPPPKIQISPLPVQPRPL